MTERNWGARYFHEDLGLLAVRAAQDVVGFGPIRYGPGDEFWTYSDGLWRADEKGLHKRIVKLLGERYRRTHALNVRDVLRAEVDEIAVAPTMGAINVPNGMLHWGAPSEPVLLEHGAAYESTAQLPVEWRPGALCPAFDRFLSSALDPDDIDRVWEILGYLVMSGNPLQRMFLLTGAGGNGKGVLLSVIRALVGERNTSAVPLHAFVNDRFAPADLFGKLVNIVGEIPAIYIEDTAKIKELAGQDVIRAERKNEPAFQFEFWGCSIFSANSLPGSADSSVGWLRRWEVINFPNTPQTADRGLRDRLITKGELEGILVKAVLSLRMLMDRGEFARGESATAVHHEFAKRSNKLLSWIDDDCLMDPSAFYSRREMLTRFRRWDRFNNPGAREMGSHKFYEMLRQVAGVVEHKRGVQGFKGVRFADDVAMGAEIVIDPEAELPKTALGQNHQLKL